MVDKWYCFYCGKKELIITNEKEPATNIQAFVKKRVYCKACEKEYFVLMN